MSQIAAHLKRSRLLILIVFCLAALTATTVYAGPQAGHSPPIGDPDAIVPGKLAVGTGAVGAKALTVVGTIDFRGAGTVSNFFTQGAGNNMQINSNVDDTNAVGDATRSQWKLMLGSSLNQFSIRRSPAGASYNEDALFFINGSTGRVAIATVDTGNMAVIPFTPSARLHVEDSTGDAIWGITSTGFNGVYGESGSTSGNGVYGYTYATAGPAYGVWGQSESTDGYGVVGEAWATSGLTFGVYGFSNSPAGYAGWFDGDVNVNGTLTKSAGGFRIDHPLDPSGMYLNHSFVESPDMKNLYDGVVSLDANGEAWVELPEWFDALNMDFRYQLTPIGEAMPNLHIFQEIEGNRFKIAGGIAEMKVSWQVTGIRHDPYAEANRIQVEVQKPAEESAAAELQEARPRRPGH